MYTFGYSFRPWRKKSSISDGESIRTYIRETAEAYGIDRHIRFRHRVKSVSWSSADGLWTVEVERGPEREPVRLKCNFLFACAGYYDYAAGYSPAFAGVEKFRGRLRMPSLFGCAGACRSRSPTPSRAGATRSTGFICTTAAGATRN